MLIVVVFNAFNLSIYLLLTQRLANNFSDTSQGKMIDVKKNLPHEEELLIRLRDCLEAVVRVPWRHLCDWDKIGIPKENL